MIYQLIGDVVAYVLSGGFVALIAVLLLDSPTKGGVR